MIYLPPFMQMPIFKRFRDFPLSLLCIYFDSNNPFAFQFQFQFISSIHSSILIRTNKPFISPRRGENLISHFLASYLNEEFLVD